MHIKTYEDPVVDENGKLMQKRQNAEKEADSDYED